LNKLGLPNSPKQPAPTSTNHSLQRDTRLPTDNPILDSWQHALTHLSSEDFTIFTEAQEQAATPPCPDPSGHSNLIHTKIAHFTYGEWQSVHDVHSCLQGLHKLLNIHVDPPLLSQPVLDQILTNGLPPYTWTSPRHVGPHNATSAHSTHSRYAELGTMKPVTSWSSTSAQNSGS
jgi:hypothetical protein